MGTRKGLRQKQQHRARPKHRQKKQHRHKPKHRQAETPRPNPVYKLLHGLKNRIVMQLINYIATIFVVAGIASALVIAADLRSCRQPMRIMQSVWILTGLWAGVFGLWAYFAFGRARRCKREEQAETPHHDGMPEPVHGSGMQGNSAMPGMTTPSTGQSETTLHGSQAQAPSSMKQVSGMSGMPGMTTPSSGQSETTLHGSQAQAPSSMKQVSGMSAMSGMKTGSEITAIRGRKAISADVAESMPAMDAASTANASAGMKTVSEITAMPGMKTMSGMPGMEAMPARPRWQSVVLSTLHCGAGCTLADLTGEWFLYFVPVAIGGSLLAGTWIVEYLLALVFGIAFQYAAIRAMEPHTPRRRLLGRAAKADILSLTAWQAGMYGWMAIVIFLLNGGHAPSRTTFVFWFMMQIGMAFGFLLSLPVNVLLIRRGIKHGM